MQLEILTHLVRRTRWVLLIEATVGAAFHLKLAGLLGKSVELPWYIVSLWDIAIFVAFVFYAIRYAPTTRNSIAAALIYWFGWQPILAVLMWFLDVSLGIAQANYQSFSRDAEGVLLSLVLYFPIPILIAWVTSLILRRSKQE